MRCKFRKNCILLIWLLVGISGLNEAQIDLKDHVEWNEIGRENILNEINGPRLLKPKLNTYFNAQYSLNQFVSFCDTQSRGVFYEYDPSANHHWFHYPLIVNKSNLNAVLSIPDFQINQIQVYIRDPKKQVTKVIEFGDELSVELFNMDTRTCQGQYSFQENGVYDIYVKYNRPGVIPTLYLELTDIQSFVSSWNFREWIYGLAFGFLATYLLYIIWVFINKPSAYYGYFLLWVLMNFIYYIISTGYFKYYLVKDSENWYSGIRQASVILALFGITQFALEHYKKRESLIWITRLSLFLVSLTTLIILSTLFTDKPIYLGYENYLILTIRLVIFGFIILQFYLPFIHYRKYKEITFLSIVLIFAIINMIGYIVLSNVPNQANFDDFNLFSVLTLVFEVIVVAWGAVKFAIEQEKQKSHLIQQHIDLQKAINQQQNEVQEKERMRIALDLHDDALNRMSILLLLARDQYIDKTSVLNSLEGIYKDIKHYILGLYPYWTKEAELNSVIKNNLLEIAKKLKIELVFNTDFTSYNFSKLQRLQLFRISQEFIQNSGRHGKASKVCIDLEESEAGFQIQFQDNGLGFDPNEIIQGLGTQGAKQRIQILGGSMQIISAKGEGVKWIITIPKFASLQTLTPTS
jgi:signal transduction histidine kinase